MWRKESQKARRMREEYEGKGIRSVDYHKGIFTKRFEEKEKQLRGKTDDGTGTRTRGY